MLLSEAIFPNEEVREFFRDELGGSLEVTTNYDYIEISASSKPDQYLTMLETLANAITNPVIDKATTEIVKSRLAEKLMANEKNASHVADLAVRKRLLEAFPYGRPLSGSTASIKRIDFADLRFAYDRLFGADNVTLAISGNFPTNVGFRAARRYFGSWLKADKKVPSTFRQPDPPPAGMQIVQSPEPGVTEMRYAIRGVSRNDKDYASAVILARIMEERIKAKAPAEQRANVFVRNYSNILPGVLIFGISKIRTDLAPSVTNEKPKGDASDLLAGALGDHLTDSEFNAAKAAVMARVWKARHADALAGCGYVPACQRQGGPGRICKRFAGRGSAFRQPHQATACRECSCTHAENRRMTSMPRSESEIQHAAAVREMFSGIAGRYDLLNHLLSANIDKAWRRKVRSILDATLDDSNAIVLDVACGTGDLSIELQRDAKATIIGTDFCRPMLAIAKEKAASIPFVEADAMDLGFADDGFDAVTIAFGLRNLSNVSEGLAEFKRVLKPGGRLVVLEFSSPVVPGFRGAFRFYFSKVLPRIGGLVSGSRGAYEYLPDSVAKFPDQKDLAAIMRKVGFVNVEYSI